MENERPMDKLESLFESTSNYVETSVELAKLKVTKKTSEVISEIASKFILGAVLSMALMVLNIAVGLWIGELLGKTYYGFFVLAAFYAFTAVILYVSRHKWLKNPVANAIIKKIND